MKIQEDQEEIIVADGKAAEGFPEGEEARLAVFALDESNPTAKRAEAIKQLRKMRYGMRIPAQNVRPQ